MSFSRSSVSAEGVRFSVSENGREVARAYLFVMHNDLHEEPFGLMEDVFVDEQVRGKGIVLICPQK